MEGCLRCTTMQKAAFARLSSSSRPVARQVAGARRPLSNAAACRSTSSRQCNSRSLKSRQLSVVRAQGGEATYIEEEEVVDEIEGDEEEAEEEDAEEVEDAEEEEAPAQARSSSLLNSPEPVAEVQAEYALNVLWLDKSIGLAVDQVFKAGQKSPVTEYFFWPKTDAWEALNVSIEAADWISERDRVLLLNKTTDIINYWQDEEQKHTIEEARAKYPDVVFQGN